MAKKLKMNEIPNSQVDIENRTISYRRTMTYRIALDIGLSNVLTLDQISSRILRPNKSNEYITYLLNILRYSLFLELYTTLHYTTLPVHYTFIQWWIYNHMYLKRSFGSHTYYDTFFKFSLICHQLVNIVNLVRLFRSVHSHHSSAIGLCQGITPLEWRHSNPALTHMLLVATLRNTRLCKNPEKWLKPWHVDTHLRILS